MTVLLVGQQFQYYPLPTIQAFIKQVHGSMAKTSLKSNLNTETCTSSLDPSLARNLFMLTSAEENLNRLST